MKKILIIEDEPSLAEALRQKLTKEKFDAVVAKDGQEGLVTALKNKPDLILLDIVMPVMDGLTMLEKLRQDKWGKNVPVIILSNLNEADKTAEAMAKGVYDYLVKSDWKLEDLVKKVREKIK
ncbi:MAG: response regulator [Candidatus Buchananbacteria bacterium]